MATMNSDRDAVTSEQDANSLSGTAAQGRAAMSTPTAQHHDPRPSDNASQRAPGRRLNHRAALSAIGVALLVVLAGLALVRPAVPGAAQALVLGLVFATCVAAIMALVSRSGGLRRGAKQPTRVAVIGSQASVIGLEQELAINEISAYVSVGWIDAQGDHRQQLPLPRAIGGVDALASIIQCHQVDLLLIGPDAPRRDVFDELVLLTDDVSVRVCELASFYETAFGHIPASEINSTWFQYVMHPKYDPSKHGVKRVFDIVASMVVGIATLPLLFVSVLMIRLDGGRALYRQVRIGEKGRPFTMYKLRTMHDREDHSQTWCSVDDPRVTRVGHVLRRLHIDELPQLYNVLRGEMSMVGPRPEQPEIASRLENSITFYARRHLMKPGLAGWAQLRCGYARSDEGSASKLCYDLYYLKHQSLVFDTLILLRTIARVTTQLGTFWHPDPRRNERRLTASVVPESAADGASE